MKKIKQLFLIPMFIILFGIGIILLTFTINLPSHAASETTFVVNTTSDTDDGICDGVHCSLREAINAANNMVGADIISFSLLPGSTITLAGSQLPTISDTLTIDGSTAVSLTISGDNLSRVFRVGSGTAVTMTSLIIAEGHENGGGGIQNLGNLSINNSKIRDNLAIHNCQFQVCPEASGGGIANIGTLNISNSTIIGNGVRHYCYFLCVDGFYALSLGGGIYNLGILNIKNSTLQSNVAYILCDTCDDPLATGGGVVNSFGGIASISNSTFSYNVALIACEYCNNGSVSGGGISSGGLLSVTNSTITSNTAEFICNYCNSIPGGNLISASGGGISSAPFSLINTIIANNFNGDCVSGSVNPNLNNLIEDGSCDPTFTGDPSLGPLQDNGGPTWTHAPSSFSLAVDNGDDASCAAPPIDNLDQRGVARPFDGDGDGIAKCDIGAYEYDGPPPLRSFLPIIRGE